MKKIISVNKVPVCSGHLLEVINIQSEKLIEIFGKPIPATYGKSDWEWILEFEDGDIVYIYDWKVGKNYLGDSGISLKDITDWHIGGDFGTEKKAKDLISFLKSSDWAGFDSIKNKLIFSKKYLEIRSDKYDTEK